MALALKIVAYASMVAVGPSKLVIAGQGTTAGMVKGVATHTSFQKLGEPGQEAQATSVQKLMHQCPQPGRIRKIKRRNEIIA